jgi:hypothetical protein
MAFQTFKLRYIYYLLFICTLFILISACIGSNNPITTVIDPRNAVLQQKMNEVINDDYRNTGIVVKPYMTGDVLIFDLQSISNQTSRADVFRVFLQFAEKNQNMTYPRVELAFRGETKFYIDGLYYKQLGEEYSWQNPVYTIRTFPSNLYYPDGSRAYSEWTGGLLGVLNEEMKDFLDFNDRWYWDEMIEEFM